VLSILRKASAEPVHEVCHDRAIVIMEAEALSARDIPSKWLINAYRRWGEARLGTTLTGNIMIEYDQLEAPSNAVTPP
jgi:hypothetical protein